MEEFFFEAFFEKDSFNHDKLIQLLELLKENAVVYSQIAFTDVYIYNSFGESIDEGFEYLKKVNLDDDGLMLMEGSGRYFQFGRTKTSDWLSIERIDGHLFEKIMKNVIPGLVRPTLQIAFVTDYWYNFFQSTDVIARYQVNKLPYQQLRIYFNTSYQLDMIDISENPGREYFLPGLKFIPAFKIWFGTTVHHLFGGKQHILSCPQATHAIELINGIMEIQLMDDINECGLPLNQEKQTGIIKYLGVDKLPVSRW